MSKIGTLVGVCGRKRAGKDSLANVLVRDGWKRVAFADAVRDVAIAIDPYVLLGPEEPHDVRSFGRLVEVVNARGWDAAKEEHPDVRRLLQKIGTEGVRDILGQDLWVDHAMDHKVIPLLNEGYNMVITDVRFPNEIDSVRSYGGEIWRIDRPGLGPDVDVHVSEMAWRRVSPDRIILNDEGLDELAVAARKAVAGLDIAA